MTPEHLFGTTWRLFDQECVGDGKEEIDGPTHVDVQIRIGEKGKRYLSVRAGTKTVFPETSGFWSAVAECTKAKYGLDADFWPRTPRIKRPQVNTSTE